MNSADNDQQSGDQSPPAPPPVADQRPTEPERGRCWHAAVQTNERETSMKPDAHTPPRPHLASVSSTEAFDAAEENRLRDASESWSSSTSTDGDAVATSSAADATTPRAVASRALHGYGDATPPRQFTPRRIDADSTGTPTPPDAPRAAAAPPLLAALRKGTEDAVRQALNAHPEAARQVFADHGLEPPLCVAVRFGSSVEVVRLLLQHAADVRATNVKGHTALALLSASTRPNIEAWCGMSGLVHDDVDVLAEGAREIVEEKMEQRLLIATLLIEAGADPLMPGTAGRYSSLDIARAAGNKQLEHLYIKLSQAAFAQ